MIEKFQRFFFVYIVALLVAYLLIMVGLLPAVLMHGVLLFAFIPVAINAVQQLRNKRIGSEIFLVFATIVAFIGNQEQAIATVLLIMLFAEYLADLIKDRTEHAIQSLVKLIPTDVIIKTENSERVVPIANVQPGMQVLVKTGRRIPVDGIIAHGAAHINEAALTGESKLQYKTEGQGVFAGTFVEEGSIVVTVEKVAHDTFFGKITALVLQAQESKAKIASFADLFATILVPTLLIAIAIVWLVTRDTSLVTTLLVFGSPLELTLITPLAVLAGTAAAFKHGILVRGGLALEMFSNVDTVVFDKTGTITLGDPVVVGIEVFNKNYTQRDILQIAAIAEKRSDHVLAKAVLKKATQEGIEVPDPDTYISEAGHGVEITWNNKKYFLGNAHYIQAPEHANINFTIPEGDNGFYSSFYLASATEGLCARILMADEIRSDAKSMIDTLQNLGIKDMILLSGDKKEVTEKVGAQLGITKTYGGMFPDQKIDMIRQLQKQGRTVAMVGDGINDAPALKQAHVGIALGAMGMEPAIEAADIVLMANDLSKIVFVYALSKRTLRIIMQNIIIGFLLIHAIGMTMAFMKLVSPVQAALFHAIPDLAILFNSARLINFRLRN